MKAIPSLKKLVLSVFTAFFVSVFSFGLLYLSPGDPAELMAMDKAMGGGINKDVVAYYAEIYGTNQGFLVMYTNWIKGLLHGDLGTSYKTARPVLTEFTDRIGCTVKLAFLSSAISIILGILFGILSARKPDGIIDRVTRFLCSVNMSVPSFWLAIVFLWLFSMKIKLFPSFGYDGIANLILPASVMGLTGSSGLLRLTRTHILENQTENYVLTARAKGLGENRIFIVHILKNILLPLITMAAAGFISHLGGSVIIENVFGLPGIGNFLLSAIKLKDFPVVLGFVFLMAVMVILVNLIVDFLYQLIDPRVRQRINA